jgi:hypothetical protein
MLIQVKFKLYNSITLEIFQNSSVMNQDISLHNILVANISLESMLKFIYLGRTITLKNESATH